MPPPIARKKSNGDPDADTGADTGDVAESETDGVTVFAPVVMEPPKRSRTTKRVLTGAQLTAFASALSAGSWVGTGATFDGNGNDETAEKLASNTARVWRRELARHLSCDERDIRTRIWKTDDGTFTCAVKIREGSNVKIVPATGATESEGASDESDADETGEAEAE